MANGETLDEIRKILASDEKMNQAVANRLILSLLAEVYTAQKTASHFEDVRHEKIDVDLTQLKNKSIIIWMERNKFISAGISVLIFIVFLVGQSVLVPAIAKALGVPLP